jgi:hypothetical protein
MENSGASPLSVSMQPVARFARFPKKQYLCGRLLAQWACDLYNLEK